MVGEDHGNLENWQFFPSFVGSFKGQEFEERKDNPDSDSLIRFFATTCATIVLARSLGDGTADRQPDPPSSLEHLSCTSPSSSSSLLLSSLGGVRQRHASCRDSVISNTAGDASAAAPPSLSPPPSKTSGPRAKTTQRTLHCTGSSRDRTEQRDGGESDGLRRGANAVS